MSLTIEHNGRELQFREDDESWSCHAMNMTAKTLKALKAKLDKFDGAARKVSLPVMWMSFTDRFARADIVMIAKPKDWEINYDYSGGSSKRERVPSVWLQMIEGNETKRRKEKLSSVVEMTPENMLAIEAINSKRAQIAALTAEAKAMTEALPRLSLDDLAAKSVTKDEEDAA